MIGMEKKLCKNKNKIDFLFEIKNIIFTYIQNLINN